MTTGGREHRTRAGGNVKNVGAGGDADTFDEQFCEVAELIRPDFAVGSSSAVEYSGRRLPSLHSSIVAQARSRSVETGSRLG